MADPRDPRNPSGSPAKPRPAAPGSATGDSLCPVCHGKRVFEGKPCGTCGGSGHLVPPAGGA